MNSLLCLVWVALGCCPLMAGAWICGAVVLGRLREKQLSAGRFDVQPVRALRCHRPAPALWRSRR